VVVGNIGSSERMEYTVIGKAANLASRLRSLCLGLDADILVNAPIHDAIRGSYRARRIADEIVDGLAADSAIYRIDLASALISGSEAPLLSSS